MIRDILDSLSDTQIRHGISMQSVMNTQFERLNVKLDNIECKVLVGIPLYQHRVPLTSLSRAPPLRPSTCMFSQASDEDSGID